MEIYDQQRTNQVCLFDVFNSLVTYITTPVCELFYKIYLMTFWSSFADVIDAILADEQTKRNEAPAVDVKVFDGPAIVSMLRPNDCKTFTDYT